MFTFSSNSRSTAYFGKLNTVDEFLQCRILGTSSIHFHLSHFSDLLLFHDFIHSLLALVLTLQVQGSHRNQNDRRAFTSVILVAALNPFFFSLALVPGPQKASLLGLEYSYNGLPAMLR